MASTKRFRDYFLVPKTESLNFILINLLFQSLYSTMELIFLVIKSKSQRVYYINTLLQRTNFQGGPWSCLEGLIVITDVDNERSDS